MKYSDEIKKDLVQKFNGCDLCKVKFCKVNKITVSTLNRWLNQSQSVEVLTTNKTTNLSTMLTEKKQSLSSINCFDDELKVTEKSPFFVKAAPIKTNRSVNEKLLICYGNLEVSVNISNNLDAVKKILGMVLELC